MVCRGLIYAHVSLFHHYFWIFLDCLVTLQQPVFGFAWSSEKMMFQNVSDTSGRIENGEAERWKIQLGMLGNTQKSDRQNLQQMFVNPQKLSCFRI